LIDDRLDGLLVIAFVNEYLPVTLQKGYPVPGEPLFDIFIGFLLILGGRLLAASR
jgi:hypothetical protein